MRHLLDRYTVRRGIPQIDFLGLLIFLVVLLTIRAAFAGGALALGSLDKTHGLKSGVPAGQVRTLAPGETITQHMVAGETHVFELRLLPKQFAQIVVEQRGVDVSVKVSAPGGEALIEMDSPNGFYGVETVSIAASVAGSYRVEVSSDATLPSGDYVLKVGEPREASASDEKRVAAERAFVEAQGLRAGAAGLKSDQASARYELAISKYKEALSTWRELGDPRGEAYSLTGIGRSYKALGQLTPALDYLGQALSRLRDAGDVSGQAFVLNETSAAHRDLGDPQNALDAYSLALELRRSLNDQWGQAQLYNNIGFVYANMGLQPRAIQNLEKALPIWLNLGMRQSEMNTLVNLARAHAEMGDIEVARRQYVEALAFCDAEIAKEASPLKPFAAFLKPFALNGLGLVSDTRADAQEARGYYKQALDLFRANNSRREEANVLDNLGLLHAFLGDAQQAIEYFRQALVIRESLNEPRGLAITLSNLGYAQTLLDENQEALRQLGRALTFSEQSRDKRFEAYTLVRMGMVYVALGEPRKALERYESALSIQQAQDSEDRRGQAITLDKIGEALALVGETARALKSYDRALELWKSVGDDQGQALSLYGSARVERDRHNLASARDRVEGAIEIVESLRGKVTGRQLRMIYFAAKQDFYALDIDVRMRLHELNNSAADTVAALWASERGRARSLNDLLSESRAELHKGMFPQETAALLRLEREVSALTQTHLRLRSLGQKEDAAIVEQTLDARIREQEELLAVTRRGGTSGPVSPLAQPLAPREIQQLLDDETLLLHYSLGETRSHLWVVARTGIAHHFLVGQAEIEKAAEQFRRALTAYEPQRSGESSVQYLARWRRADGEYRRSGLELGRLALGPVSGELGNKRLVVVADGALYYVPFDALPMPGVDASRRSAPGPAPLLLRNEVVYEPSASTLALLRSARRPRISKTVAVLADPVFDNKDERVRRHAGGRESASVTGVPSGELARSLRDLGDLGGEAFTLAKLEHSLEEADAITTVAPPGSWMKAVGFKANRATALSPALRQFRIIHFATHGILNDRHPELSGIVLSMVNERGQPEDGYLTLQDIYNLDLPVDLVVLSACRTAVGKQVRGEGLLALTRGFMYAGAPRVVASLWSVDDEATAELMKRFYQHMLGRDRMSAAAALRQAKIEMAGANDESSAPYYWAGFVLQGDWK
jgi:CHAT domain-containing protein/Tfp pilus assembly protein PilF